MNVLTPLLNLVRMGMSKIFPGIRRSFHSRDILEKNYPEGFPFRFIQVGAGDGVSHDFLFDFVRKRDASGIVLEPLPDIFEKLKANYEFNNSIIAINKAVHSAKDEVFIYRVAPAYLNQYPHWADGIASLYPEHFRKSGIDEGHMVRMQVKAEPLMKLLPPEFSITHIDLLQIDAEGYDFEILKQIDFTRLKPLVIRFEYMNLDEPTISNATRLLNSQGYHIFYEDADILAINLNKIRI